MKLLRILTAATLAIPVALTAQQPAGPVPNPITTTFKNAGARNARLLAQAFDSVPEAKYSYKPTPAQLSIGAIATHLESANYQICSVVGGTPRPTMTARDSLADTIKAKWPKDTLVTRLKASFAFCDAAIATVDDAKLSDMVPAGTRTVLRAQYLLVYVTDLVDHYSQMANYMRGIGMLPPSALPQPGRGRGGN